jgi:HEPN domain-containing protein
MNAAESVEAWIEKAEGDYHTALAAMRQRKHPLHDAACFHCQQEAVAAMKQVRQFVRKRLGMK